MEKNKLLNLAESLCKFLKVISIAGLMLMIGMLIYWHFSPDVLNEIITGKSEQNSGISFKSSTVTLAYVDKSATLAGVAGSAVNQGNLKYESVYLLFAQAITSCIIWLLILKEIRKIISSVQGLQTFRQDNSSSLRKIGWYCFYVFLVFAIEWLRTDTLLHVSLHVDFLPLIFMLICFVLAEIFEEGNKLYEEEQLTI